MGEGSFEEYRCYLVFGRGTGNLEAIEAPASYDPSNWSHLVEEKIIMIFSECK